MIHRPKIILLSSLMICLLQTAGLAQWTTRWTYPLLGGFALGGASKNLDADPQAEIVFYSYPGISPPFTMYIIDGSTGMLEYTSAAYYGLVQLAIEDLDNDGRAEILVQSRLTSSDPLALSVFDYSGGTYVESQLGTPSAPELKQNYPNPFNPNTVIEYEVPTKDQVVMVIYNSAGQTVRKLFDEPSEAGKHVVLWDGRNDQGVAVSSGVYFYQLLAGSFAQAKKMILVK